MIDWRNFITTVSAAALLGIFSIAWMSHNELQKLSWNMPQAMERIAKIENKVDRIENLVRIEKESDRVVRLIERE